MEPLSVIEIPEFITKVKTANKIRTKYYKKKKDGSWYPRALPKTYKAKLKEGVYSMDGKYLLIRS